MISRKIAMLQCNRLAGTEYFGALSDECVDELVAAIRSARDEGVALSVVNEWLATQKQRPTPADLYRMIRDHQEPMQHWSKPEAWGTPDPVTDAERAEWAALNERIKQRVQEEKQEAARNRQLRHSPVGS